MRKTIASIAIAFFAVLGAGAVTACEPVDGTSTPSFEQGFNDAMGNGNAADDSLPPAQKNAAGKAREYLSVSAFSRTGLIQQLEFEGFNTADATFGVDHVNPDWNEQAVKKAGEYMSTQSFSQQGLIDQLVFEGFTQEQAEQGAASQF